MLANTMLLTLLFPARIKELHGTRLSCHTAKFRYSAGKSCIPKQNFRMYREPDGSTRRVEHLPDPELDMISALHRKLEELTGLEPGCTRFLRYHADNDDSHMDKLYGLIDRVCTHENAADDVVRTASVVARLYALQLEEIDVEP